MTTVSAPISKNNLLSPVKFERSFLNSTDNNITVPQAINEKMAMDNRKSLWSQFKTFFSNFFKKLFKKAKPSQDYNNSNTLTQAQAIKSNPNNSVEKTLPDSVLNNAARNFSKALVTNSCCSGASCSIPKPQSKTPSLNSCCAPSYRSWVTRAHQPSSVKVNSPISQNPTEAIPMIKSTADLEQGLGLKEGVLQSISQVTNVANQSSPSFTLEERANDFSKFLASTNGTSTSTEIN